MRSCGRISYKFKIKGDNRRVLNYWQELKIVIRIEQVVTTITTTDNNYHKHNKNTQPQLPNNNNNQTLIHHRYNL